ncbi:tetratricopeptide repeat protein [Rhodohalobacter sp. 8-1]|uniref:tetratricopeptide repeat protein n=1 Tax=Rhodohalobacter sp. 8-1 TaxID=3131972 RepID=UPI0030EE26C2
MNNLYILVIICLFFTTACATSSSYSTLDTPVENTVEEPSLFIPAGVDSATAAEAEQIANSSFVSFEEEQRAEQLKMDAEAYRASSDTMWYYLTLNNPNDYFVSQEDSVESIRTFNKGAEFFIELNNLGASSNLPSPELQRRQAEYLNNAIASMEESVTLNPFEGETRYYLAQLYEIKATRLQNNQDYQNAIDVLEKLTRVEKGDPLYFEVLADNYTAVGNYPKAADNFKLAREVKEEISTLTDFYFENGHISEQDSLDLFLYAYYEGEAYTNYLQAPEALKAFELAKELAPTDEDKEFAEAEIEFINWDNGNIKGSFARDSLVMLVNSERLNAAESGFKELKPSLQTQTARDEVDWRLAVVEYQLEKDETAADRLMNLVNRTPTNEDGMPVDSTYIQYFSDYGLICFNIGQRHLGERDRRTALKYFRQSKKVKGQFRARANLQIADLLQNNISEAINHAKEAENEVQFLNENDTKALYSLLTDLHRRDGNLDEARRYRQLWSEL